LKIGSREEIRNERLTLLKNRWVYVLAQKAEEGGQAWLDGEYWFDDTGKPHRVNLQKQRGRDIRTANSVGEEQIEIPARLNGDSLRVFIGASPFQLNWQRIQQLCKDPSVRCYEIGAASTLGTVWIPQRLEQHKEPLKIFNSADPNLEGIEQDTLLVGVRDLLSQACERNREYRKALDHFLEVRFDTTVKDDGKGNISLENSQQQSRSQLEQMTAGLVIHALTGGKDGAPMDEVLMRKCLLNDGANFKGWLSQKMHAHTQAYVKVHSAAQKVASFLQDSGWEGVEGDIAALMSNREASATAFDYLFNSITRLEELDSGRDIMVQHFKGKHPVLNEDTGIIATGKAAHKNVEPYVKVVNAMAQVYAATPAIEVQQKRAAIWRLLQNGLDAKINVISDSFNKHEYLEEFVDAAHGETLEFERFEIDRNSVAHMRNIDSLEFLMDSFGAVLDGLSVGIIAVKIKQRKLKPGDGYELAKNVSALTIYFGKLKYFKGTKFAAVTKKANPVVTVFFSSIDAAFCYRDSYKEFGEDDVDAGIAKRVSAAGHLMTAAGTLMILFPPTAVVGVGVLVLGTVLGTGGGIWHGFADDTGLTMFLKRSPWGNESTFSSSISGMEDNQKNYLTFLKEEAKKND